MKIPPEPKDRRTKAYKEWAAKFNSKPKGLGDVVESVTEATGIKKLVKFIAGEDCGCDERKEALNVLFPRRKVNCILEDDYDFLTKFLSGVSSIVTADEQRRLVKIYNYVFDAKKETSSCGRCVFGVIDELKRYIKSYE
jgi:predicted 3-demethylubiquinone-9 3-methyltransferase (glyoxalase superfamily)